MSTEIKSSTTIRNFRVVHDWLLRGGQPDEQGLLELAQRGVKTILSLRAGKKLTQIERAAAENLGMRFIHMPVYYLNLPDDDELEAFLGVLDEAENHPIFVHCFHGADRTGFLIAVYRMARLGWHVEDAYEEMKQCGFHQIRLPHFKWILWNYARRSGCLSGGNNQIDLSVKQS